MTNRNPLDEPVGVKHEFARQPFTLPYGWTTVRPADVLAALTDEQREELIQRTMSACGHIDGHRDARAIVNAICGRTP